MECGEECTALIVRVSARDSRRSRRMNMLIRPLLQAETPGKTSHLSSQGIPAHHLDIHEPVSLPLGTLRYSHHQASHGKDGTGPGLASRLPRRRRRINGESSPHSDEQPSSYMARIVLHHSRGLVATSQGPNTGRDENLAI
ncbi:hypothetical protein RJ55_01589 [Drechmeria coniospora]|nr:hypothetical protein RJ55_01589 [Drechmeria coniospora]